MGSSEGQKVLHRNSEFGKFQDCLSLHFLLLEYLHTAMRRRKERGGEGRERDKQRGKERQGGKGEKERERSTTCKSANKGNHSLRKCLHRAILTVTHPPPPFPPPPPLLPHPLLHYTHTHIYKGPHIGCCGRVWWGNGDTSISNHLSIDSGWRQVAGGDGFQVEYSFGGKLRHLCGGLLSRRAWLLSNTSFGGCGV